MITSDFQYISMDLVYLVVFEVFVFGESLFLHLRMEVINVLSHNAHLFVLAFEVLQDFRESKVPLVGLGFRFYLIKIAQPLPCLLRMLRVEG